MDKLPAELRIGRDANGFFYEIWTKAAWEKELHSLGGVGGYGTSEGARQAGVAAADDCYVLTVVVQDANVTVNLPDAEALAVAQFLKRVGWAEMRQNAVDDDEAYLIRSGLDQVRAALADAGYSPR